MPKLGWKHPRTLRYKRLWDSSKTIRENMKAIGIGYYIAIQFARANNMKYKSNRTKIWKWNDNMTIKQLAKLNGVSYNIICQYKKNKGLNCITHLKARMSRIKHRPVIKFLKKSGFTYREIGRLYDVSRQRIEQMEKDV